MRRAPSDQANPFAAIRAKSRLALIAVGLFSGVVNILALTGSFYMLQVYDRVLSSRSVATLVAISLLCLGLFALQGGLEIIRTQVMSRIGARIERDLLVPVHDLLIRMPLAGRSPAEAGQPVRDMESLRAFMSGQAPIAFLDLPWMPLYLAFIFLLHPMLGVLSLGGMMVLVILTLLTETKMRAPTLEAASATARRFEAAEMTRRNAEVLKAMGFADKAAARFFAASGDLFRATEHASDIAGSLGGVSRVFRIALQSAVLGLGAWLVLKNQMSAGAIIASSIISGRAMAPVELAIGNWRLFAGARQAWSRLNVLISSLKPEELPIALDMPKARIQVEGLSVAAPGGRVPIIRNARMTLAPGDAVAVLGPSAAGKSSLMRGLVGAWPTLAGTVRLDGAPLAQYPEAMIGKIIGYLPQDVELFEGTIAENIARLDAEAPEADIIAAAHAARAHDMILRLPDGYKTRIGGGGYNLSVGQRQRIGLARALYGEPFLVVLDEPNAHLDQEGDAALGEAIAQIRARNGIVLVVSHRPSILKSVNLAALVKAGELIGFGPRDEVLKAAAGKPMAEPQGSKTPAAEAPQAAPPVAMLRPVEVQSHSETTPAPRPHPGLLQTGATLKGRMSVVRSAPAPAPDAASSVAPPERQSPERQSPERQSPERSES